MKRETEKKIGIWLADHWLELFCVIIFVGICIILSRVQIQ